MGFMVLLCLLALFVYANEIVSGRQVDQKIEMYIEENKKIEEQINIAVEKYMTFESDTYKSLKGNSGITLVSLYPELKSDELIKIQIETYTSNNEIIKKLKLQKINIKTAKWWVYFGK